MAGTIRVTLEIVNLAPVSIHNKLNRIKKLFIMLEEDSRDKRQFELEFQTGIFLIFKQMILKMIWILTSQLLASIHSYDKTFYIMLFIRQMFWQYGQ